MNIYSEQQCQDEKIIKNFKQLHISLVNTIVEFCKNNNIDIDEFLLTADNFKESIKFGSWHASTDSCLIFENNKDKPFLISI